MFRDKTINHEIPAILNMIINSTQAIQNQSPLLGFDYKGVRFVIA
ncbi:MAG: hypothetical protein WCG34_07045 [Leptolinea sp.]